MAKCVLLENLGEGHYKIESRYSSAAILARQTAIDHALADTEHQRVVTQAALDPDAASAADHPQLIVGRTPTSTRRGTPARKQLIWRRG